jgi:ATP-binding protein involved in chromosome partitioning
MTARAPKSVAQNGKPAEPALAGVTNIIAVASGKGGVGKSTTTVNLAYALARAGAKVGIVDADVYGPSLLQMTKVEMPSVMNGDLVVPPVRDGVKIISSAMFTHGSKAAALRGPMVSQLIRQFLTKVDWGELDYLLIDYPPGTGDVQITLSQMVPITGAVIVTTPQEVSLIDVRRAVSMFDTVKIPVIGVVENMSYFICNKCTEKHELFPGSGGKRLSAEIGMPLLATFPMDPQIARRSDEGEPFVLGDAKSAASGEYTQLAANLAREVSVLNHQGANHLESFKLVWRNN